MSRRATGWLLLALALAGAALVVALGVRDGRADAALVLIVSLGLVGAATTVVIDRRVLARRAVERDGRAGGGVADSPGRRGDGR